MGNETKKYLVTDGPIGSDRIYLNGEEIELDARCAKRLLNEKKIRPVEEESQKVDSGKTVPKEEDPKGKKEETLKDKPKGSTKGGKK